MERSVQEPSATPQAGLCPRRGLLRPELDRTRLEQPGRRGAGAPGQRSPCLPSTAPPDREPGGQQQTSAACRTGRKQAPGKYLLNEQMTGRPDR